MVASRYPLATNHLSLITALGLFLSLSVRIAQIAFDGEVFAEAVQMNVFHLRGLAHVAEAGASGERDRPSAGENFGRVIKEDFVDDVGGERCPVDGSAAFDHHAGDLEFSEAAQNGRQVWATVGSEGRDLLDANPELFEL